MSFGFLVIERSNVGIAFRLFNNMKITIDGYLIGWKYYHKKYYYTCAKHSYVTVFGKRGSEIRYKHITSTLLQPESLSVSGIRFQFVQNNLAPVRHNDLLGMYGEICGGGTRHLVSGVILNNSQPTHIFRLFPVTKQQVEGITINRFIDTQRINVSLQAYVTGLLSYIASRNNDCCFATIQGFIYKNQYQ